VFRQVIALSFCLLISPLDKTASREEKYGRDGLGGLFAGNSVFAIDFAQLWLYAENSLTEARLFL
jgi:hypothetical protein